MNRKACARRGFTLVELMIVIALAAILLALAIPSFTTTAARKRLEGTANELATDIQYARTEAAARNRAVGIVFGNNCWVVYVLGAGNATSCTVLGSGEPIKSVTTDSGISLAFTPPSPRAFIAFDPARGMAVDAATGAVDLSGYVTATHASGNWQIRALVTKVGRVKLCSPNNTITGLATDCT